MATRPGRSGRPARLSQAAILAAAKAIVERDGHEHLSMRGLAKELASTPMALYHYVRDKDELLVLLLEEHATRFVRPELPEDPRERLIVAAVVLHDVLAGCPWIVEILAAEDLMAASALWIVEDILDAACRCGMTEVDAVYAYRAIWYYTAGELLIRLTRERRRAAANGTSHRDRAFATLEPDTFPRLSAVAPEWAELTTRDTRRRGLEDLVDGMCAHPRPDFAQNRASTLTARGTPCGATESADTTVGQDLS